MVTLALKLADLTHADREVVEAAAWLHDVRKEQENHFEEGANLARRFLPQTNFTGTACRPGPPGSIPQAMG